MTYTPETIGPLSAAVGRVVIEWNRLEHIVVDIASSYAALISPPRPHTDVYPIHITLFSMKLRERITATKALAATVDDQLGTYGQLEELLNKLDNEFRVERNRFVHSLWFHDIDPPSRLEALPRVSRPQARTLELQIYRSKSYASVEEVAEFGETLANFYDELSSFLESLIRSEPFQRSAAAVE